MDGVVGVYMAIGGTGVCFIPPDWKGRMPATKFIEINRESLAYGKKDALSLLDIRRKLKIADSIVKFISNCDVDNIGSVATELVSYVQEGASYIVDNAELAGIVKSQVLLQCRRPVVPLSAMSARSFLVGDLKRSDQRLQVESFVKDKNMKFETWAELRAFVVAYYWYCNINNKGNMFLPQKELF